MACLMILKVSICHHLVKTALRCSVLIYPRQIKAARALLGISQAELADLVDVSIATLKRIESRTDELRFKVDTMLAIQHALEAQGITFVDADGELGLGVRLTDSTMT